MKLARYWARESGEAIGPGGSRARVEARGWSNASLEAARQLARTMARRIAETLVSGQAPPRYPYGDRPLPEPIVREFADAAGGDPHAVVTRNAYGALVLSARHLMFVDIDREEAPALAAAGDLVSGILSLFGKAAPAAAPAEDPVVADVRRVAESAGIAARLYKTAAGYRAIVTSARFEPDGRSEGLLRQFGADPLYVRLCRAQQSYRARLTPKPWRCGLAGPPVSFPFDTPEREARFRGWEAEYAAASARYATCRYLAAVGGARTAPEFDELIQLHDRETKATASLPLA